MALLKSHRIVCGLRYAMLCSRPPKIPHSRPRGSRAQGLRYERALAKALLERGARPGQWFKYEDRNGIGHCQTDIILPLPGAIIIIECKLGNYAKGEAQLRELYLPVARAAFNKPVYGLVACRHLSPELVSPQRRIEVSLDHAIESAIAGAPQAPLFHWIGRGKP